MTTTTTTQTATSFKWTIAAIRHVYEQKQHPCHFFDRSTMRFFGQTMSDFRVKHIGSRVFFYAPTKHGTMSVREFIPTTGALQPVNGTDLKAVTA